jgi:preprotein translocase subunit SecY
MRIFRYRRKGNPVAQARIADCVVEQAKKLSLKINYASLLPMGMAALIYLLAYGSMLL